MKITQEYLKQVIKEEIESTVSENDTMVMQSPVKQENPKDKVSSLVRTALGELDSLKRRKNYNESSINAVFEKIKEIEAVVKGMDGSQPQVQSQPPAKPQAPASKVRSTPSPRGVSLGMASARPRFEE